MPVYSKSRISKKFLVISLVGLIIVAGALVLLESFNIINLVGQKAYKPVATPTTGGASVESTKGETASKENKSTQTNGTQPGDAKDTTAGDRSISLITPSGDFVSNHHPKMSGLQTSVCTTTPGATCAIVFTKGGEFRSLATQTTDRAGSTYWNAWTPASVGLSPGTWEVKAVATLNGAQKESRDAIGLIVSND